MDKRTEAVAFFRSEPFLRLFTDFRNKYESLGRIGGSVSLKTYEEAEIIAVAEFLGKPPEKMRHKRVSLEAFEKRLAVTKFEELTLFEILQSYFGERIVSKKEQVAGEAQRLSSLFATIEERYPELSFWVSVLREKPPSTYLFFPWMEEEEHFLELMQQLNLAFCRRPDPGDGERLPKFSQRITGDPHAFDTEKKLGKLWIHLLSTAEGIPVPRSTEGIAELMETYGVLRDDLMNYVTCANLLAEEEGNLHPVWWEAYRKNLARNVTLRELVSIDRIYPAETKEVFVVENSGVCSMILDEAPTVPIVATQGQVKLSTWKLLDSLVENGAILKYSGDFDPEGLKMADLIKKRYEGNAVLWHMSLKDYEKSVTDVVLPEARLKKLDTLETLELIEVAKVMRKKGKSGYQEALVEEMIREMKSV
ncbi:TIGR02679 family protein [Salimicrobium flavidum]|uniref:TIGR02679 family protein n=1 Tax=Salimicrobium flavidum TaxID=570947 RepID=A0A1N7J6C7_9BACI|nr:TIGR02679 family protein [Salimicrobium flavidum]SIS44918.1 TIGR02679 family protein [Salimicrobium flavidum]